MASVKKRVPVKKAAKKVAKKAVKKVAKKTTKPVTVWEYYSLKTGKKVSETYGKANPKLVKKKKPKVEVKVVKGTKGKVTVKTVAPARRGVVAKTIDKVKSALKPKAVTKTKAAPSRVKKTPPAPVASNRFEERVMVNGLQSNKSYCVVSRVNEGDGKPYIAMRLMSPSQVRVHAFPNFAENGVDKLPYSQGRVRSQNGYQTCWVPADEAKALMIHLQNQGYRLLNAERLNAFLSAKGETEARSALALH